MSEERLSCSTVGTTHEMSGTSMPYVTGFDLESMYTVRAVFSGSAWRALSVRIRSDRQRGQPVRAGDR